MTYGSIYTGCSFHTSENLHGVSGTPSGAVAILGYMGRRKKITAKPKREFLPLAFKAIRERNGWTQEELAALLETTGESIGRYEAGEQNWNVEFLVRSAKKLGCDWWDLLPIEGDAEKVRRILKLAG